LAARRDRTATDRISQALVHQSRVMVLNTALAPGQAHSIAKRSKRYESGRSRLYSVSKRQKKTQGQPKSTASENPAPNAHMKRIKKCTHLWMNKVPSATAPNLTLRPPNNTPHARLCPRPPSRPLARL